MALGYNLVFGKGKIFHFGPLGVSIATAYAMFIVLMQTQSYSLAILSGMLMAVIISLLFAWLSLRLEPDALGVMTIAMHLTLLSIVLNWTSLTRGALGIPGIPRLPFMEHIGVYAGVTTMIALLAFFFFLWLEHTAFGRQIAALAEHEWHAKSLGIHQGRIHAASFVLLGIVSTIGVLLAVPYLHLLHPNDFQFPIFIFLIMTIVVGNPGSVRGVTLATILLVCLKEALRFLPLSAGVLGPLRLIFFGLILLGAVWIRRDTLFPQRRTV